VSETTDPLKELEDELASVHLRGQWQGDPQRALNTTEGDENGIYAEPVPSGVPHIWPWTLMEPLLAKSLDSMAESKTARRTLAMSNPGLPRGTTQNLITAIQIIHPGEVAWVHRHTITALRFVIQGGPDVYTVVDGEPLAMEPYDLILTPNWTWHDHHNQTGRPAIWLDALDVPLVHNLNQIFYEEPGATMQNAREEATEASPLFRKTWEAAAGRPLRYAWSDTLAQLKRNAEEPGSPHDGIALEYVNTVTGGSALPTIGCWVQMLPPGFEGVRHRHTSSAVYFVIGGAGATEFDDQTIDWQQHDTLAVPNWAWHRHVNRSSDEPAYLFSVNDIPVLRAFGLYREEPQISLGNVDPLEPAR
jgi:1-hydroxy-2-naphthoate dioxygenase